MTKMRRQKVILEKKILMEVPPEETPSTHTTRASKPFCLNNLATPIYKIITKKVTTTYQEVADIFVATLDKDTLEESKDKTLRRRVYDVINVLIAADLLEKNNKQIHLTNRTPIVKPQEVIAPPNPGREEALRKKQLELAEKIKMLIYYKYLIERNRLHMRPQVNIQFPSIVIGYRDISRGTIFRSLDGHELKIKSVAPPLFFSPIDIFRRLKISKEEFARQLRQFPMFAPYESIVMASL